MKKKIKKLEEKLNQKSRMEQIFLMGLICIGIFGLICLTGCGGEKCETVQCSTESEENVDVGVYSIPGCGGCLTSGRGCDSCLWPQSCKYISVKGESGGEATDNKESTSASDETDTTNDETDASEAFPTESGTLRGCDTRYYGNGCLGCGQEEKSCYFGYVNLKGNDEYQKGIFYGDSDKGERLIGCTNEGSGCVSTDDGGASIFDWIETLMEDE